MTLWRRRVLGSGLDTPKNGTIKTSSIILCVCVCRKSGSTVVMLCEAVQASYSSGCKLS